jgi:hypothetical protein
MAEVAVLLAAPAAIAALLQLVDQGISVASVLYRTSRHAGAASRELEGLAHRIQFFSTTVRLAKDTLNRHCAQFPESPVVLFIEEYEVLRDVENGSKFLRGRLEYSAARLKAMSSNSALWMSIKWAFKRSSFLELLPELDGFQADLSLLAQVAGLEALNMLMQSGVVVSEEQRTRLEDERYVFCGGTCRSFADVVTLTSFSLEDSIKGLVKTVRRMERQLNHLSRPRPGSAASQGQRAVLLELGRSMYKSGAVPDLNSPPATPRVSESSYGQGATSRRSFEESRGNEGRHRAPSPGEATFVDKTSSHDAKSSAPVESRPSRQDPSPPPPRAPQSPALLPRGTNTSSIGSPAVKTLQLDRDYHNNGVDGYVTPSGGTPRAATAAVSRDLDGNVISLKEVYRLGLVSRPLVGPSAGVVNLVFGPGEPERSVGKVTLQWTADEQPNERYPPVAIECDVSERSPTALVFGRPFLDARSRFWPR